MAAKGASGSASLTVREGTAGAAATGPVPGTWKPGDLMWSLIRTANGHRVEEDRILETGLMPQPVLARGESLFCQSYIRADIDQVIAVHFTNNE
jgi:hypothetical protein